MKIGGIVLCGGKSTRMGRAKAMLPFGGELMLQRVARLVHEVVSPIVVVAAMDQELPPLPAWARVVRDEYESLGPLAGLAAGLAALRDDAEAAYATACDVPLLVPAFIRQVCANLQDDDLVIPRDGAYHHPLAAVYRVGVEPAIRALLAAGRLRPVFLLERTRAREIDVEELRSVDPQLLSLRNTNTLEDYAATLKAAGLDS
jgi:molybdenum cofactor guanylyltransferase